MKNDSCIRADPWVRLNRDGAITGGDGERCELTYPVREEYGFLSEARAGSGGESQCRNARAPLIINGEANRNMMPNFARSRRDVNAMYKPMGERCRHKSIGSKPGIKILDPHRQDCRNNVS